MAAAFRITADINLTTYSKQEIVAVIYFYQSSIKMRSAKMVMQALYTG